MAQQPVPEELSQQTRPTVRSVAREANVGTGTVMRYLNNRSVAPPTADRIRLAIEHQGFVAVRRRATPARWGVVMPSMSDFFCRIMVGINEVVPPETVVFVMLSDESVDMEREILKAFGELKVDGVIVAPVSQAELDLTTMGYRRPTPVVAVDRRPNGWKQDVILTDNREGSRIAVGHLIAKGYKDITMLVGSTTATSTNRWRKEGFLSELQEHGQERRPSMIVEAAGPDEDDGYTAMLQILKRKRLPEAVFTGNEILGLGAMRAMNDSEVHHPNDLVLVTYDYPPWAELAKVTGIEQEPTRMGKLAAQSLLGRISGGPVRDHELLVPNLVDPDSTPRKVECRRQATI